MKKKLINTVLILFVSILSNNIFAQTSSLWRPFSDCYIPDIQNHSDCTPETVGWKTFNITTQGVSCNVGVGYRIKRCNLPTPTIFIDLNYISVSLYNCPGLICLLHPGNSEPPPNGCINNPLDYDFYERLENTLYRELIKSLFDDIKNEFECPTNVTFRRYAISSCRKVCGAQLYAPGQDLAWILVPKKCTSEICCYKDYYICKDSNNQISLLEISFSGLSQCPFNPSEGESCFQVGDTINLLGINYTVISVSVPYCEPGCNSNYYLE